MKKVILQSVLFSIAAFVSVQDALCQETKTGNSMLWSIVNPEAPSDTSYLFGTIHQIAQKDFAITDKIENAFGKSEVLITEIDLTDPGMFSQMMPRMMMSDGMTLDKIMSPEDYQALSKFMTENTGQPLAMYNDKKPFMAAMVVMNYFIDGTPASYDMTLTQMAQKQNFKIKGLETVAEQMDVLDKTPYDEQAEQLIEMINNVEKTRESFAAIVEAYKAEHLEELDKLLDENMEAIGEKADMLDERNIKWIPKIEEWIKENRCFIAVGAGHLPGELGLINLLREKGYEVNPVFE